MPRKEKRFVIFMNQTKLLLFVVLLLITPSIFGQSFSQKFKNTVNNIKKEAEFSKAIKNNKAITPEDFKDASKYTVIMVFNHAVNQDNYEAAKVMLDYLYANKYDKKFITKYKTIMMGQVIKKSLHFYKREGNKCYFKYDMENIQKWPTLLIDINTDLQVLYEAAVNVRSYTPFEKYVAININEVIKFLREIKYK